MPKVQKDRSKRKVSAVDTLRAISKRQDVRKWLPIVLVAVTVLTSFIYGWYFDNSTPHAGIGWSDQTSYYGVYDQLSSGNLPKQGQLHFTVGYPLLGVIGGLVLNDDPFMLVSLSIIMASSILCFLAVKELFGTRWALLFSAMLLYWDGIGRSLHFASELFVIPWNNQLLFLLVSFYFWLFVTRSKEPPSWKLVILASSLSGLTFLTREETILFSVPAMTIFLLLTKAGKRKLLVSNAIIVSFYLPQLIIKLLVGGSATGTGRSEGYGKIWSYYFRLDLLYRNVMETIIHSSYYGVVANQRQALLQAVPWLWLSPVGIGYILKSKQFSKGLKWFAIISIVIMLFYLSGANMSAQKLSYNCLRYISPGFILLNLGVLVVIREAYMFAKRTITRHQATIKAMYNRYFASAIGLLPVILPAAAASFGVVAASLLLLGELTNILAWPLGLLAAGVTTYIVVKHYSPKRLPGTSRERKIFDLLVVIGALVWLGVNVQLTSQNIYVNRDPAIYSVAGAWLVDSDNLNIPQPEVLDDTTTQSPVTPFGAGFSASTNSEDEIYAQGLHLLPVFLGLVGRVAGESAMLHANPIFGAAGLLAVYGFGRLLVRPRWAALATSVIAISLPLIAFSRDTFSEPLAMMLTFGALALLWGAQQSKSLPLWFVAGLTLGAGALTRIDAYLTLISIVLFMTIFLSLASKNERGERLKQAGVYSFGAFITTFVGWLDLSLLSSGYYRDLRPQFNQQVTILAAVIVLGGIATAIAWNTTIIARLDTWTKSWRSLAAAAVVLLLGVFLISRPLWYVSYGDVDVPLVRGLQMASGNVADGARDYAEQTTNWIAWYIGPVLGFAGIIGASMLAARATRKKDLLILPGLIVIIVTAFVFLNRPSITPDQIWASRRLLPVILPGVAIFGVVALEYLFRQKPILRYKEIATAIMLVAVLVPPLIISYPFLKARTHTQQLQQMNTLCSTVPENAVIVWVGEMSKRAVQTTRAFCDVPAVGAVSLNKSDLQTIGKTAAEEGYTPIIAVDTNEAEELLPKVELTTIGAVGFKVYPNTLYTPPRVLVGGSRAISIGIISTNGDISMIGAAGDQN
jgi:hypothetical protein